MKWKWKQFFLAVLAFVTINCEGQSIVKRWQTAGRLVNGKIDRRDVKSQEYDFSASSKFTVYENGDIVQSGTYVLAADKKSMVLKDGDRSGSIKILKLTASELHMVLESAFGGKQTLVLYPASGTIGKNAKKGIVDYNTLRRKWVAMHQENLTRVDLLQVIAVDLKHKEKENEFLDMCIGYKKQMYGYSTDRMELTEETVEEYGALQDKIEWGFTYVLHLLKEKYPTLKAGSYSNEKDKLLSDHIAQMHASIEASAERAKAAFDDAYKKYTQR